MKLLSPFPSTFYVGSCACKRSRKLKTFTTIISLKVLIKCDAGPVDCFSKLCAYITHNATEPQSDSTEGNLPDHMKPPQEQQKVL